MFLHYRVQTDHRGLAHLTIRMSFEQNIHQLLDIYIDGPPPLTNTWIIIIPQGLFLTRLPNWNIIRNIVQQNRIYPLRQRELNEIASRITIVEEVNEQLRQQYEILGHNPRRASFRITMSYIRI